MTVPIQSPSFEQALFRLAESHAKAGFIPNLAPAYGTKAKGIAKNPGRIVIDGGMSGPGATQRIIRAPFVDQLGANAGSSYTEAYIGAQMARGDEFLVPLASLWAHGVSDETQVEIERGRGANISPEFRDTTLKAPIHNFWLVMGPLLWDEGFGIFGVGDGVFSVAGSVVKLKNLDAIHKFHVGQRLTFCDPAQVVVNGQIVTPRALGGGQVAPKIIAISTRRGEMTLDVNLSTAIPSATNGDWLVPASFHQSATDVGYARPIVGCMAYVPRTDGEVAQPLFGVDRTVDEAARAGIRVKIEPSTSVEDVVAILSEQLLLLPQAGTEETSGTLYFPSRAASEITRAFHRQNVTVRQLREQRNDAERWTLGVAKQAAVFSSGHVLEFMPDKMFSDPHVTREEDNSWFVELHNAWELGTTASGFGFKRGTGESILRPVVGNSQALSAAFGMWGNLMPCGVGMNIYLSPSVDTTDRYTYA